MYDTLKYIILGLGIISLIVGVNSFISAMFNVRKRVIIKRNRGNIRLVRDSLLPQDWLVIRKELKVYLKQYVMLSYDDLVVSINPKNSVVKIAHLYIVITRSSSYVPDYTIHFYKNDQMNISKTIERRGLYPSEVRNVLPFDKWAE